MLDRGMNEACDGEMYRMWFSPQRDVQRGLVPTSIVNYDGFEPTGITVLPVLKPF